MGSFQNISKYLSKIQCLLLTQVKALINSQLFISVILLAECRTNLELPINTQVPGKGSNHKNTAWIFTVRKKILKHL